MGCSSAGKSTFISQVLLPVLKMRSSDLKVIFAHQLRKKYRWNDGKFQILHYNCLYPNPGLGGGFELKNDPLFQKLKYEQFLEVFYCYTPDDILMNRIKTRRETEPNFQNFRPYPNDKILALFRHFSQSASVSEAAKHFISKDQNFSIVLSGEETSTLLHYEEFKNKNESQLFKTILSNKKCTNKQIEPYLSEYSQLSAQCARFLSS